MASHLPPILLVPVALLLYLSTPLWLSEVVTTGQHSLLLLFQHVTAALHLLCQRALVLPLVLPLLWVLKQRWLAEVVTQGQSSLLLLLKPVSASLQPLWQHVLVVGQLLANL